MKIPQEQIYACKFILKEFLTAANAWGLQGHQGGDFQQQNVIKSVELTPMAAYSSTRDSRRKVLNITLCREVEHRAIEVITLLKAHLDIELTEVLVYTDELFQLEGSHGHMILKSNSFEMWRTPNSRLTELCEELLPVSPYRVIFTLKSSVSIAEFVDRCLKWNEGEGQLRGAVMRLLDSKGYMLRPIHKVRSDAAGAGASGSSAQKLKEN